MDAVARRVVFMAAVLATTVQPRDPNYAVRVTVPDPQQPTKLAHTYRLVSLPWLDYLARTSSDGDTLDIYYKIESVPDRLTIKTPTSARTTRVRRLPDNVKAQAIALLFERVINSYLYDLFGLRSTVKLHRNAVDRRGVPVDQGRHTLNRTVLLEFADPPYGQSTPNRLVTNRRIPWVMWDGMSTESLRFRPDYNMTEDLLYRYYHNLGHTFGLGHYEGSENPTDPSTPVVPHRSVMYANYADARYSAPMPLPNDVDERVMRLLLRTYPQLIRENVRRFNRDRLAPALLTLVHAAARLA